MAIAQHLLDGGRYEEALRLAGRVLMAEPEHRTASLIEAECRRCLGDPGSALVVVDRVLARAPDDVWDIGIRARACAQLGRREEAIAAADRAIRLAPGVWALYAQRADVGAVTGERSGALQAAAREAVRLAPAEARAHVALARAHLADRRPTWAQQELREALRIEPGHSDATALLSMLSGPSLSTRLSTGLLADDPSSGFRAQVVRSSTLKILLVPIVSTRLASLLVILASLIAWPRVQEPSARGPEAFAGFALLVGITALVVTVVRLVLLRRNVGPRLRPLLLGALRRSAANRVAVALIGVSVLATLVAGISSATLPAEIAAFAASWGATYAARRGARLKAN